MAGRFDDGQAMVAKLDDVVAGEQSGRLGQGLDGRHSEEFFGLKLIVRDEVGIVVVNFDLQAKFVEDETVSKVVVEVSVRCQ